MVDIAEMRNCQDSVLRLLSDYYRCPAIELKVEAAQSGSNGFFCLANGTVCYGLLSSAPAAQTPSSVLPEAEARIEGEHIALPFSPEEVVRNLRLERYSAQLHRGRGDLVRQMYYLIRPFLPVAARKHLQRMSLRNWDQIPFPQWPVDRSADRLHEWLLTTVMKAKGINEVPFIWFWPDGHSSCAVMTHDVETRAGRDRCGELMDVNDSFGIKSSFQIVPEERYPVSPEFLDSIRDRAFEVNVHDLNHDGNLFFLGHEEFQARLSRINRHGNEFGARGFRSAVLYRRPEWMNELKFDYDMSVPNVAHLDPQRGGCCTVMPYFIGDLLEIPVTTTQDYSLFHILNDDSAPLWEQQLATIREAHGMATFIVHPDYVFERRVRQAYTRLLQQLAETRSHDDVWIAKPGEVSTWWRQRSKMRLVDRGSGWTIEGDGSEHARLAHAFITDGHIDYRVDSTMPSTLVATCN